MAKHFCYQLAAQAYSDSTPHFAPVLKRAACRSHQAEPDGQEKPTGLPKGVWAPAQAGLQCIIFPRGDKDFRWQNGILQEGKWEWPVHLPNRGEGHCDATVLACQLGLKNVHCAQAACPGCRAIETQTLLCMRHTELEVP